MKLFSRGIVGLGFILACVLLAGCETGDSSGNKKDPYTFDPLAGEDISASSGLPGSGASTPRFMTDTNNPSTAILHAGDSIGVTFNDIPNSPTAIKDVIKEDGSITLYFNERFQADGKTVRELQEEIRQRYVPRYYKYMTPSVEIADRFYSVGGEVKAPNRYVWTPGMTVLRAIDGAGGFTDFSRKGRVTVTRASTGKQEYEDCVKALKHPESDLPVYPGDRLFVKKKIW
jgi:protein involved in polysaccharide export with SLBB domain